MNSVEFLITVYVLPLVTAQSYVQYYLGSMFAARNAALLLCGCGLGFTAGASQTELDCLLLCASSIVIAYILASTCNLNYHQRPNTVSLAS